MRDVGYDRNYIAEMNISHWNMVLKNGQFNSTLGED